MGSTALLDQCEGGAEPPARSEQFEAVLALTRDMREQAEGGEWDAVAATERQRERLIRAFFGIAPTVEEAGWIAEGIREILDTDRHVMELGRQGMRKLAGRLHTIGVGRKAQRAYRENLS